MWLVMTHTFLQIDAVGKRIFSCSTPFACLCHGAFRFFFLDGEIFLRRSNDNNLKEMRYPHTIKLKLTTHLDREA